MGSCPVTTNKAPSPSEASWNEASARVSSRSEASPARLRQELPVQARQRAAHLGLEHDHQQGDADQSRALENPSGNQKIELAGDENAGIQGGDGEHNAQRPGSRSPAQ